MTQYLEIIGESSKRVPDDYRTSLPTIPWRGLAGLRDVLIHQYEEVNLDEVWRIVECDLPILRENLMKALPPQAQLEQEITRDP